MVISISVQRLKEIMHDAEVTTSQQQKVLAVLMLEAADFAAAKAWHRIADKADILGIAISREFLR